MLFELLFPWRFLYEEDIPYLPLISVLAMEHDFDGDCKGQNMYHTSIRTEEYSCCYAIFPL